MAPEGRKRKAATGVHGLDEITSGGLPAGRPTLLCGGPGCGKTMLAIEFLVHGALEYGEPGVLISFDERIEDLEVDSASLGFDLADLRERQLLATDYVHLDRSEFQETGEYDLEGLFVRLALAVQSVGARRVVLDTIDSLFAGIPNEAIVRAELRRLFRWIKEHELTAIVTAERGDGELTRSGIEEYVSDCVILLDHRVQAELSTRRLRIVKYRGSRHGTNEYPFLIGETGFSVFPVTSLALDHGASTERVPTGISGLDRALGGQGFFRGSSVLFTGGPGTGKTSVAASVVDAACRRGERCVYFSFEESPGELMRNLRSIGIDLTPWLDQGLLRCQSVRPSLGGLEMHLALMYQLLDRETPDVVVVDPLSALFHAGVSASVEAAMLRLIDLIKHRGITGIYVSLMQQPTGELTPSELGVSSIMDTWIAMSNAAGGERLLWVVKGRGLAHSSRLQRMTLSRQGLTLAEAAGTVADAES